MFRTEMRRVGETLSFEQKHARAKQAFEEEAASFDGVIEIEDAWQHLDNWNFNPAAGGPYRQYTYSEEAKMQAVEKLVSAHQTLAEAFANLTEESQRDLVERPIISFECQKSESEEAERANFGFNLPEIVTGFEAWQRLGSSYDHRWRQAVRENGEEMKADEYGLTYWQSRALFHDSVNLASKFLIAGKKRFYASDRDLPETRLALARIGQMEELSEIYLKALSHGDEATRLALHEWICRVNGRILCTCENSNAATDMFQIRIDLWIQNTYPHEGALIPIGQTMIRKKNAKYIEHNHYIVNC